MGKSAKFKKLRKLANQLPAVNVQVIVGQKIEGKYLDVDKDAEGNAINPEVLYGRKKLQERPLSHLRNLKRMYYKHGMKGAAGYAQAVVNYANAKMENNE